MTLLDLSSSLVFDIARIFERRNVMWCLFSMCFCKCIQTTSVFAFLADFFFPLYFGTMKTTFSNKIDIFNYSQPTPVFIYCIARHHHPNNLLIGNEQIIYLLAVQYWLMVWGSFFASLWLFASQHVHRITKIECLQHQSIDIKINQPTLL